MANLTKKRRRTINVKSSTLQKNEYGWKIIGELQQSDTQKRSIAISIIITNNRGKLVNAGYDILTDVPPNTPYPFDVSLVTQEEGNIKIVEYPISLDEDIPSN